MHSRHRLTVSVVTHVKKGKKIVRRTPYGEVGLVYTYVIFLLSCPVSSGSLFPILDTTTLQKRDVPHHLRAIDGRQAAPGALRKASTRSPRSFPPHGRYLHRRAATSRNEPDRTDQRSFRETGVETVRHMHNKRNKKITRAKDLNKTRQKQRTHTPKTKSTAPFQQKEPNRRRPCISGSQTENPSAEPGRFRTPFPPNRPPFPPNRLPPNPPR